MGKIIQSVFQSTHLMYLNLNVPWIALGTAEVESVRPCSEEELMEVVYTSFEQGIRVVDTASNYYAGKLRNVLVELSAALIDAEGVMKLLCLLKQDNSPMVKYRNEIHVERG